MVGRFKEVTGFVLAGGASRRMGRPKEALVLGSETLLARQLRLLRTVCRSAAVIGAPAAAPPEVPVFADEFPGRGPLGGIYTALGRARTEYSLVLGCDLPFVTARWLRYLAARAIESRADVTVAATPAQGCQPLCAVYRGRARHAIGAALGGGRNKVTSFYRRVRVETIGWREAARAGFGLDIFNNVNTPLDFEAAHRRVSGSGTLAAPPTVSPSLFPKL